MKKTSFTIASVAIAIFSSSAVAQSAKPVSLGVSVGAAIPVGDFADAYKTGYNATVSLGLNSVGSPVGLRIDGMYNSFSEKDDLGLPDYRIIAGTANLVFALPGQGMRPYLIGGAGAYAQKPDVSGADYTTDFGVNGGIGTSFQLSGFNTFVEARFHHVFSEAATQFIPVTFGISF